MSLLAPPRTSHPSPAHAHAASEHDVLVVYALRSIALFPSCRRLAWYLGEALFSDPAARTLAACLLTSRPVPDDLGPVRGAAIDRLAREVLLSQVPPADDPQWGVHIIRLLAEREHLPILAATLRWAAGAVLDRVPLRFVLRRVLEAFAAAAGARPLDAALIPGGRKEWTR